MKILKSNAQFDLVKLTESYELYFDKLKHTYCMSIRNMASQASCHPQTIKNAFKILEKQGKIKTQVAKLPSHQGDQTCSYLEQSDFLKVLDYLIEQTRILEATKIRLKNFKLTFELQQLRAEGVQS
jgi:DNA-binding transcriptional regulator YhcF (GntR family)